MFELNLGQQMSIKTAFGKIFTPANTIIGTIAATISIWMFAFPQRNEESPKSALVVDMQNARTDPEGVTRWEVRFDNRSNSDIEIYQICSQVFQGQDLR